MTSLPSLRSALPTLAALAVVAVGTTVVAAPAQATTTPSPSTTTARSATTTRTAVSVPRITTIRTTRKAPAQAATPTVSSEMCVAGMKSPIRGNMVRKIEAISARKADFAPYVQAVVIEVAWADLEPTQGVYTFGPIDTELATIASLGKQARLRVNPGTFAPQYVKEIGGAPVPFFDHGVGRGKTTIGRYWLSAYQARWQALQTALAARYDANPNLGSVNISGTGVISSEVMLTMGKDMVPGIGTNESNLKKAGLTEAARRAALMADISFMQRTWVTTHTTLWAHPYQTADGKTSLTATKEIIDATYAGRPGATEFGHTGASSQTLQGTTHSAVLDMYSWIVARNYPFTIQTQAFSGGYTNEGVGDLAFVLNWLATHGVRSVELPTGFQSDVNSPTYLTANATAMAASAC